MSPLDQQGHALWRRLNLDQKRKVIAILERLLEAQNHKAGGAA
ncbi:hypothetical protein ACIU1J_05425 [Azospirillum doebereinerae]|nr:hypothetical protein [Azospirillum doebereinerae]